MAESKSTDVVSIASKRPIRVLLLDDREENLILRSAILRQNGYDVLTSMSIEEALKQLPQIDIAVLDYLLGAGKSSFDHALTPECNPGNLVFGKRQARQPSGIAGQHFGGDHDIARFQGGIQPPGDPERDDTPDRLGIENGEQRAQLLGIT